MYIYIYIHDRDRRPGCAGPSSPRGPGVPRALRGLDPGITPRRARELLSGITPAFGAATSEAP